VTPHQLKPIAPLLAPMHRSRLVFPQAMQVALITLTEGWFVSLSNGSPAAAIWEGISL
jgi:hypothetical protein